MKYETVWDAVDKLAEKNGLSPSGLARKAGLDSTTFNKSKRIRTDGKKRWPSLDSINKILDACNITFEQFYNLANNDGDGEFSSSIPYIKHSKLFENKTKKENTIDTSLWDKIRFPDGAANLYAIDLDTNEFEPYYRKYSTLIVSKNSEIRQGDKVIIINKNNDATINEFIKRTAKTIEVSELNHKETEKSILINDIKIINRILWAGQ